MKEFVCRFPDEIHEKLREESFLRKKSMADIVREAMHDYCQNKATKPISNTTHVSPTKKNPSTISITQLSASCLQKIWDNEEDDFFNDL